MPKPIHFSYLKLIGEDKTEELWEGSYCGLSCRDNKLSNIPYQVTCKKCIWRMERYPPYKRKTILDELLTMQ